MLEMTIEVRVPKGRAMKTEKKLRGILLNLKKPDKTFINKEDNMIKWVVVGEARRLKAIQRTVLFFDHMISKVLDNKIMSKFINKNVDKEGRKELTDMLLNHTHVEVKGLKVV